MASDESEDLEASTPAVETTTPSASAVTLNGRRKSGGRKPKKKPLVRCPCSFTVNTSLTCIQSEETISPEDEEDDPMATNGFATPVIASPLPVRSGTYCTFFGIRPAPLPKYPSNILRELHHQHFHSVAQLAIFSTRVISRDLDANARQPQSPRRLPDQFLSHPRGRFSNSKLRNFPSKR